MSYFSDLGLAEPLLRALETKGYADPTPIQRQSIPALLHLRSGFTLRCIQRLSLPNVATQWCRWRDNWYTRGWSNPVLSY